MPIRLSHIVAAEATIRKSTHEAVTGVYHALQKGELIAGIARSYTPLNDEGERLPPEETLVRSTVKEQFAKAADALGKLFDVTATRDFGNCQASADVVVDGVTILAGVPPTFLLFLEKQLTDIHTMVSKFPTLDPTRRWEYDAGMRLYRSGPVGTVRTKKILRNHVKAEATDKHPAQVETYSEDVIVGNWATTYYSGAIPVAERTDLLRRIEKLQTAVKSAREEANTSIVPEKNVRAVIEYILGE